MVMLGNVENNLYIYECGRETSIIIKKKQK